MANQPTFSTTTIAFIIIGLLIGAGGGYLVSSNSLQPQINELEAEMGDLTSEVSTLSSNISTLENEKAEYEDRVQSLEVLNSDYESQISLLNEEKSNYESQIIALEDENEVYESQVSQLQSSVDTYLDTVSSLQDQIFDKNTRIDDLESILYPKSGYKFAAYGFSFEYPDYMYLTISGVLEMNANENSGGVVVTNVDESQLFAVVWAAPSYPRDTDLALEEGFTGMYAGNLILGQKVTSTFNGHEIKYQDYTAEFGLRTYRGVLSGWNCDVDEKVYSINYMILGNVDPVPFFTELLESFICHSSHTRARSTETVTIGLTVGDTDDQQMNQILANLAIEDINEYCEQEGLPYNFRYVIKENLGQASIALQNTQAFKQEGIDLIVGHPWSSQCQASLPYVNQNNMLLLSYGSTNPLLNIPGDNLFRLVSDDTALATAISEVLWSWGIRAIIVIHRDDTWGDFVYDSLYDVYTAKGGIVAERLQYAPSTSQFNTYLSSAEDTASELVSTYSSDQVAVVMLSFGDDGWRLISQASAYPTLWDLVWFGSDGTAFSGSILDNAPQEALHLRVLSPYPSTVDSDEYHSVNNRYLALTGSELGFYRASLYDSFWVYAKAIFQTGKTDALSIKSVLADVAEDHYGVTGWCNLNAAGDRASSNYGIIGYGEDGRGDVTSVFYGSYDGLTETVSWFSMGVTIDGEEVAGVSPP